MINSVEIHVSSSSSSSPVGDSACEEISSIISSVVVGSDSLSEQVDANSASALPEVYEIDADLSEIDLCDSELSEVEEVSPETEPAYNWYRSAFPHVVRQEDPIVERMLGLRMNRAAVSESLQSDIFARILDQVRSQALIINRLSGYQPTSVSPSVILSKLVARRIANTSEAVSLGSCPICLEGYTARMTVRVIPGCEHLVHKPCMDKWIMQSNKNTCPLDNLPIEIPEVIPTPVEIAQAAFGSRRSSRLRRRLE